MMKPNAEWLMQLPKELQIEWTQEIFNFSEHDIDEFINKNSDSFWCFMAMSFTWESSEKGHKYWEDIAAKY